MLKPIVLKYFSKILQLPRLRVWHENTVSADSLFGARPGKEKLWNRFKRDLILFSRHWLYTQWIKTRTLGVHIRTFPLNPVTPEKKFLIAITKLPLSMQSAERCIKSAKQHGEDYNLEIMPAIDKFGSEDFFARHNLTWNRKYAETTDPYAGMGCFSSHYKIWEKCVEIGKPVMVLEHDSVFLSPVPKLKFKHVIMLGKPYFFGHLISDIPSDKGREIFHPWKFLRGTHCYAITPEGAGILLEKAPRELLPPVDLFMNKSNIDILYYHPAPVGLDVYFTSVATREARILRQQKPPATPRQAR